MGLMAVGVKADISGVGVQNLLLPLPPCRTGPFMCEGTFKHNGRTPEDPLSAAKATVYGPEWVSSQFLFTDRLSTTARQAKRTLGRHEERVG